MREFKPMNLEDIAYIDVEQLRGSTEADFTFFYIDISAVSTNKIDFPIHATTFREAPSRARKRLRDFDILLSTVRPNLKAFAIFQQPDSSKTYVASTGFAVIRQKEGYDIFYIFYCLLSEFVEKQMEALAVGSNYPALNSRDIRKLKILTPSLPTQQKIARILSTLDGVIDRTEDVIAKYTALKAGLLQNLFTRGIDASGQLRPSPQQAPDLYRESALGLIPIDWEVVRLDCLTERIFVGIATSSSGFFADTGITFLRNQNIKENRVDASDVLFITKEFADLNQSKYLEENDVITVRTGYPGQSAVVPKELEGSQTFTTLITRPNPKLLDSFFLSFFMNSEFGKKQVYSLQGGGAQQNLNSGELETLKIFKLDVSEQKL